MNLNVTIHPYFNRVLDMLNGTHRHNLYSRAANQLKIDIQAYLRKEAGKRHKWATKLGGDKTNHISKGAARISFEADSNKGVVTIPIAGISRAFHDVTITPTHGDSLTIPVEGPAYGHRVAELRRMGWAIFRPHGQDALWGSHEADDDPMPLYVLRKRVTQRQDRTLLPSDGAMNKTVYMAMKSEFERLARQ